MKAIGFLDKLRTHERWDGQLASTLAKCHLVRSGLPGSPQLSCTNAALQSRVIMCGVVRRRPRW